MKQLLRTWRSYDMQEIGKHLLIIGDAVGDCASCRELGIDPWKTKECPQCHTVFKFIASRRVTSHPGERFSIAKRIMEGRSDLEVVDFDDYQKAIGNQKARDFFKT